MHGILGPLGAFTMEGPVALADPGYEDAPRVGGRTIAAMATAGAGGAGKKPEGGWEVHGDRWMFVRGWW
ncbi:hypothetical protein GCM10009555_064850 [Acrocarpospora macrocephala]|uniref:Uncharacterized protein n=1 Tax=Acrocarpospora macrocephala TaxID=150177 RepID=A0A5M3X2Q7_9ACTN|nr:hypothetical protein Amac_084790 [Acrocarpospora macrocephala]